LGVEGGVVEEQLPGKFRIPTHSPHQREPERKKTGGIAHQLGQVSFKPPTNKEKEHNPNNSRAITVAKEEKEDT